MSASSSVARTSSSTASARSAGGSSDSISASSSSASSRSSGAEMAIEERERLGQRGGVERQQCRGRSRARWRNRRPRVDRIDRRRCALARPRVRPRVRLVELEYPRVEPAPLRDRRVEFGMPAQHQRVQAGRVESARQCAAVDVGDERQPTSPARIGFGCSSTPHRKPSSMLTSSGSSGAGTASMPAVAAHRARLRSAAEVGRALQRASRHCRAWLGRSDLVTVSCAIHGRRCDFARSGPVPRIGDRRAAMPSLKSWPLLSHTVRHRALLFRSARTTTKDALIRPRPNDVLSKDFKAHPIPRVGFFLRRAHAAHQRIICVQRNSAILRPSGRTRSPTRRGSCGPGARRRIRCAARRSSRCRESCSSARSS